MTWWLEHEQPWEIEGLWAGSIPEWCPVASDIECGSAHHPDRPNSLDHRWLLSWWLASVGTSRSIVIWPGWNGMIIGLTVLFLHVAVAGLRLGICGRCKIRYHWLQPHIHVTHFPNSRVKISVRTLFLGGCASNFANHCYWFRRTTK